MALQTDALARPANALNVKMVARYALRLQLARLHIIHLASGRSAICMSMALPVKMATVGCAHANRLAYSMHALSMHALSVSQLYYTHMHNNQSHAGAAAVCKSAAVLTNHASEACHPACMHRTIETK